MSFCLTYYFVTINSFIQIFLNSLRERMLFLIKNAIDLCGFWCLLSSFGSDVIKLKRYVNDNQRTAQGIYRNDPKFSDRYAWANSADPDQRSSLIGVYTVCHSACIVWTHYSMVEPHSSNFRVITTNILGVRIFRKFRVPA